MLEIRDLKRTFKEKNAVDGITFCAREGEILGIVGPNGAGKTTLFSLLTGILVQDAGSFLFAGLQLRDLKQSRLGFLAESPFYFPNFTAREMILFENTMRDIDATNEQIDTLIEEFGIADFQGSRMRTLSQGIRKRVALVCSLLGSPEYLVLDEPLNGLDIQTVIILKRHLLHLREAGSCILISSHVLSFFDGLVDRVLFLCEGKVVGECDTGNEDAESAYERLFMREDTTGARFGGSC